MIRLKQINNAFVRPIHYQNGQGEDKRPLKGKELFDEIYANIFICAKKKSGKTVVVNKIVSDCATSETTVMVFASTVDKDQNHLSIKQYCKLHNIPYISYTSMKDDGVDIIDVLIKKLQDDAKALENPESDDEEDDCEQLILFDSDSEEEVQKENKIKQRKSKYKAPEYMIIIDDLSNELKSKTLIKLLKMNRHYKIKVIISSQYANDLLPESIKQMDYALLFAGESEVKLLKLHKDLDLSIDFAEFKNLYYMATAKKYNFLYVDVRNEAYRCNFTHEWVV